jgi:hypothetical protein
MPVCIAAAPAAIIAASFLMEAIVEHVQFSLFCYGFSRYCAH